VKKVAKIQTNKISSTLIKDYKNLEYINKPFNDKNTIKKWKSIGHNYQRYTGSMIDQSNILPDWCYEILNYIPLNKSTITLYCMEPAKCRIFCELHASQYVVYFVESSRRTLPANRESVESSPTCHAVTGFVHTGSYSSFSLIETTDRCGCSRRYCKTQIPH
jgi:hypothetical protein